MADTTTLNFKFVKPSFNKKPWQQDFYNTLDAIDAVLAKYILIQNFQGVWQNATAYTVGQRVADSLSGGIFTCLVNHTSSAINTFAQDRVANPSFWSAFTFQLSFRNAWASNTAYALGDIVTFGQKLAIANSAHTSSSSFVTDQTNGLWNVLIDGSAVAALPAGIIGNADQLIRFDGVSLQYQLSGVSAKLTSAGGLTVASLATSATTWGNGATFTFGDATAKSNFLTAVGAVTLGAANVWTALNTFTVNGVVIGGPTGGDKGAGNLNIAGELFLNGLQTSQIAQIVNVETGAVATGTTTIPATAIPTNTQGDQYMSLAITPKNAASTLIIDWSLMMSPNTTGILTAALFQDSTVNALASALQFAGVSSGSHTIFGRHKMTAGTTSLTTFKVRAGCNNVGTFTFNGTGGVVLEGGTLTSFIHITEILP